MSVPKPLSPELLWLLEGSPHGHTGASRAVPEPGAHLSSARVLVDLPSASSR